jgi:hypothetical protein
MKNFIIVDIWIEVTRHGFLSHSVVFWPALCARTHNLKTNFAFRARQVRRVDLDRALSRRVGGNYAIPVLRYSRFGLAAMERQRRADWRERGGEK